MIALYTETLQQYIDNGGNIHEELFNKIPDLIVPINDEEVEHITMLNLFLTEYKLREIGAETEQLFEHYLMQKLNEIMVEYNQKIVTYQDNINKLMDRTVSLQRDKQDKNYLNPVTTDNAKLQDYIEHNETYTQSYGWFKSNPELLKQSMELKNIYMTALKSFDNLFMGVY